MQKDYIKGRRIAKEYEYANSNKVQGKKKGSPP